MNKPIIISATTPYTMISAGLNGFPLRARAMSSVNALLLDNGYTVVIQYIFVSGHIRIKHIAVAFRVKQCVLIARIARRGKRRLFIRDRKRGSQRVAFRSAFSEYSARYESAVGRSAAERIDKMRVSYSVLNEVINGKRAITTEYALKIEAATDIPANFWLGLQADYNMQTARRDAGLSVVLDQIRKAVAVL